MTAKEYLKQYENAAKLVAIIQEEYDDQIEQIDNIRSPLGSDGTPRGGGINREVEEKAVKLAEKAEELKRAEIYAVEIRQEIFRKIMQVPGDPGSVLHERYVNLKKWEEVADTVGYSVRQTHNLHRDGLEIIKSIIS